jgi:hypothetical protein
MAVTTRCVTMVALLVFLPACNHSKRPPTPTSATPALVVYPPPPLTGPSTTYSFIGPLSAHDISQSIVNSKYVLYENGAVAAHFALSVAPLHGSYQQTDEHLVFSFGATGLLRGDVLEVRYGDRLQQADFEDAAYRRVQ